MASLRDLITKVRFDVKTEPLEKLQGTLEKVKSRLDFLAAAELIRGLAELTEKFGHFAIDLQNAAEAAGLTTDALQKLNFVADEAGIKHEELGKSLSTLTKKLYEARMGSGDAALAFARAGIDPSRIKSFKNSEEALKALANSLRNIRDPIARAAAAQNLLGESGAKMLKMLSEGSEGIEEAEAKAARLGIVVSPAHIKALAQASKSLEVFKNQIQALAIQFVARLAPALNAVVNAFGRFLATHRQLITLSFEKFASNIAFAAGYATGIFRDLGLLFDWLVHKFPKSAKYIGIFAAAMVGLRLILAPVLGVIGFIGKAFDGLGVVLTPLKWALKGVLKPMRGILKVAGKMGGAVVRGFGKLFAYLFPRLAAWAAATYTAIAPYLAVAAAIAAIVVVSHDLWSLWKGGKFEDTWIGKALAAAKGAGSGLMSLLGFGGDKDDPNSKKKGPGQAITNGLGAAKGALGTAMGNVEGLAAKAAKQVPAALSGAASMAGEAAQAVANYTVNNDITINVPAGTDPKRAGESVKDGVREAMDQMLRRARVAGTPARSY